MNNIHKNESKKDPTELLPLVKELKDMFNQFFNQNWFFILLDNSDIDSRSLHDILEMLEEEYKLVEDIKKVTDLTLLLTKLLTEVSQSVLPVLREKLRISGFRKENIEFGENEYVRRVLIAQVFPDNLKRLEQILIQLRTFIGMKEPVIEEDIETFFGPSGISDSEEE